MYKTEATYDFEELAKRNLHIHTTHSPCAMPEMNVRAIIQEAENDNLEVISFTDHYNSTDFEIMANNQKLRDQAAQCDTNVKILYSAELTAYGVGKFLDSIEVNRLIDYRLYAYNHYHMNYWEHPEEKTPRGYVQHAIDVLESLFKTDRADCICHPFTGRFIRCFDDRTLVTKAFTDNELGELLEKGKNSQVAWEINTAAIFGDPDFAKRYWNIGKEVGVVFNLGTDAHSLDYVGTSQYVEQLKKLLG